MTASRAAWPSSLRRARPARQAAVTASNGASSVLLGALAYGLVRHEVMIVLLAAVLLLVNGSWSGRLATGESRASRARRRVLAGLPWMIRHPARSADVWVLQLARLAGFAAGWLLLWRHLWAGALVAGALDRRADRSAQPGSLVRRAV
jgi:Mn2+/Fe2+ NRAMP family transporter